MSFEYRPNEKVFKAALENIFATRTPGNDGYIGVIIRDTGVLPYIETLIGTILTENGFRFKYSNAHKEFVIGGFGYYTERIIITTVANIARIRGVDFDSIILTTRVSKDGYNIPPGLFRDSDVYVDFL